MLLWADIRAGIGIANVIGATKRG